MATVTPAASNSEETHNTLKFAQRAKFIPVSATRTFVEDDKALIKKYQQEIADLKAQLKQVSDPPSSRALTFHAILRSLRSSIESCRRR